MNLRCIGIVRSGTMPLLFLCLLICFHRDVPADVWKYDFERRMKRKELFIFATTCDAASSASPAAVGMRGRVSVPTEVPYGGDGKGLSVEDAKTFFESYVSGKASRSAGPDEHDNGFYIRRLMLPVGEFVPGWEEGLSTDAPSLYSVDVPCVLTSASVCCVWTGAAGRFNNPKDTEHAFSGTSWHDETYTITQIRPNK